jgi:glycosyltransferase involved in cell wall biosynthesis
MENKKRKHILLVVRYPVGGIRTYFKYIYSQEIFKEYDFTIIAPDENISGLLSVVFREGNYTYIACQTNFSILVNSLRCIFMRSTSLIHSHGFSAGVLMLCTQIIFRVPHLMTAHDVLLANQFVGLKGRLKKLIFGRVLDKINVLHAVSDDGKNNLLEFFPSLDHTKINTILHGIDADSFYSALPMRLTNNTADENTVIIGFFGRFMSQKGFRFLVDAIEIIVRDQLVKKPFKVLAFGWGGFVREEFDEIKKRNLDEYFELMPFIEDMPSAIKAVSLVVMPSLWEACGLLAMEALVAGTPIIGTSCVGLREVLEGSPASIVPPANSKALSLAIAHEINSSRNYEFSQYAHTAKERFSLVRPTRELEKIYEMMT